MEKDFDFFASFNNMLNRLAGSQYEGSFNLPNWAMMNGVYILTGLLIVFLIIYLREEIVTALPKTFIAAAVLLVIVWAGTSYKVKGYGPATSYDWRLHLALTGLVFLVLVVINFFNRQGSR